MRQLLRQVIVYALPVALWIFAATLILTYTDNLFDLEPLASTDAEDYIFFDENQNEGFDRQAYDKARHDQTRYTVSVVLAVLGIIPASYLSTRLDKKFPS